MSVGSNLSADGKVLTITINGRFDFSAHQAFRDSYEKLTPTPSEIIVDMVDTTYLDSSALGMLLLLRDHAGGDTANITLKNCNEDIRKILTISNFEQLFKI
ncbi:STAS domain-containing protein [Aliikangiella coralliicola]|uniref:STAS domain-containing protein n=1 Tax=Aliikangiella coralliicola TaxID=2592383 RepID=A0A545UB71_9GAMM|nr:STAS domain-containing protein [Aliikangiella coralliicola]TQV86711.1 STAS domain-containing protein [Aliikangiella coralliicola]